MVLSPAMAIRPPCDVPSVNSSISSLLDSTKSYPNFSDTALKYPMSFPIFLSLDLSNSIFSITLQPRKKFLLGALFFTLLNFPLHTKNRKFRLVIKFHVLNFLEVYFVHQVDNLLTTSHFHNKK